MSNIIKGTITNLETSEEDCFEHFPFFYDAEIIAIVKVVNIGSYEHPDKSLQISIDCKALDSIGFIFDATMQFTPETKQERDGILSNICENSIYVINGRYGIVKEDALIIFFEPKFRKVEPELESMIKNTFNINSEKDDN